MLVALDGPVVELPSTRSTADRLRLLLAEDRLPRKVASTEDPLVVLAHAGVIGPATERAVYAQWRRIDHEVLAEAAVVPGVRDAFATLAGAGVRITVVGALDVTAIRAFLVLHGLDVHVSRLAGRAERDHDLLPPAPDLITSAIRAGALPASSCVVVASSPADLKAARAAGVDAVSYDTTTWSNVLPTCGVWSTARRPPGPRSHRRSP